MKTLNILLLLALFLCINSCKAQNSNLELELKECINENVNNDIKDSFGKESFDFYDFMLEIEQNFTTQNILLNTTREDYLYLIKDIIDSNDEKYLKMYSLQKEIINRYGFGFNQFTVNDAIFNQCPYRITERAKETNDTKKFQQGSKLKNLMDEGFANTESIKDAIYSVDEENFKKIVYRAPIILTAMINLENKLNPDSIRLKEKNKGKKFLNKQ